MRRRFSPCSQQAGRQPARSCTTSLDCAAGEICADSACSIVEGGEGEGARSGEEVVKAVCATCHQTGVANAPKIGDKAAWGPRIKEGFNELVKDAIKGKGAMPPKGGNASLSDADVRSAIEFMVSQAK